MLPRPLRNWAATRFASAAFFANIALLLQSGYFDVESRQEAAAASVVARHRGAVLPVLAAAADARSPLANEHHGNGCDARIASFLLNVALIGSDPVATFYLPFTRAFELLAGAVLACGWI